MRLLAQQVVYGREGFYVTVTNPQLFLNKEGLHEDPSKIFSDIFLKSKQGNKGQADLDAYQDFLGKSSYQSHRPLETSWRRLSDVQHIPGIRLQEHQGSSAEA